MFIYLIHTSIFKDSARRSKTEFILGHGLGVNVSLWHWVVHKFAVHTSMLRVLTFWITQVRVLLFHCKSDDPSCEYHVRNSPASKGVWLGSQWFSGPWKQTEGGAAEVRQYSLYDLHSYFTTLYDIIIKNYVLMMLSLFLQLL